MLQQAIDNFHNNLTRIRRADYNETEVRVQFINPLFEALGWDMRDTDGRHEVQHEDRIHISGKAKAPDYGFYLDGRRKFFVEAKKPAVNLDAHADSAYQLRRYAWTAKLPLSVLTDFEEFAVYDTRVRPAVGDSPKVARLRYWRYTDYADAWDDIAAVFSREAVLGGSLDAWAAAEGGKKGVAPVDAEFLKEIERWRDLLARNIALRNPALDERGLNFAVQQTIDRLLFLRIAEDRGIEPYGRLRDLSAGGDVYSRLFLLFNQADARYNSGLFHFGYEKGRGNPDTLTPALNIDDKTLRDILKSLYEPVSPYEFSVFPADILGHVYEQFLGKVIRLTGKSAKVEEKPEVRKAGGVYYTPTYIVDYIVGQTVGKLLEGHAADPTGPVSRLRVLDPACGSGSFLLGAYQYLLDWHLRGYTAAPSKWSKGRNRTLYQTAAGTYHLTLAERKRILLDNLYGVDIDPQAVEVTKLSLLLKVLEDTPEALSGQMALLPERVLPDLGDNIKCGNSLIGPDFYDGTQAALFDMGEQMRINAFDWAAEFRDVMSSDGSRFGGFDAVIGNPPYIRIQTMKEWAPAEVEFYKRRYRAASKGNYDIYVVFVEKGLELLNPRGRLGFILPNKFLSTDYGQQLRGLISERKSLHRLIDFKHDQVFLQATTYTCLLFLVGGQGEKYEYAVAVPSPDILTSELQFSIHDIEEISESPWVFSSSEIHNISSKLETDSNPLLELPAQMNRGSSTGNDEVFILKLTENPGVYISKTGSLIELEQEILRTPIFATDFTRYNFRPSDKNVVIFPYENEIGVNRKLSLIPEKVLKSHYPKTYKYLTTQKKVLEKRKGYKEWYGFSAPRSLDAHESAQLIVPLLADRGLFAELPENGNKFCLMAGGGFSISFDPDTTISPHYLIGLLNSRLLFWRLQTISNKFRGGWITCTKQYVGTLPIRTIDSTNPADKANHDRIVALVQTMLDLHQRHAAEAVPHVKTTLQRQIEATDRQIDALVYALYGLTEEEIAIVEGAK